MKRVFFLILGVCFFKCLSAQNYWDSSRPDKAMTIGLRTGINMSRQYNTNKSIDLDFNIGFNAGIEIDLNLCRTFSINSGMYLIQKGFRATINEEEGASGYKYVNKPLYIELPLLASYRIPLSDAAVFQINIGPYFSYGIGGKFCTEVESIKEKIEKDSFDKYDGLKRFDFGLSYGAAITISKIYIGVGYEHSIAKIGQEAENKAKNSTLFLSLGYNLN